MTEIESLRQQLAATETRLEGVKQQRDVERVSYLNEFEKNKSLEQQLAAALAAIKSKDVALQSAISAHGYESGDLHDALAIQPDDTALKDWVSQRIASPFRKMK